VKSDQPSPDEFMALAPPVASNDRGGSWTAVGYSEAHPTMGFWATGSDFDDAAQEAYRMVREHFEYGPESVEEKIAALELIHTFGWKARVGPFAGLFRKIIPFKTREQHSMKWRQG
jgi:hypothetical protein